MRETIQKGTAVDEAVQFIRGRIQPSQDDVSQAELAEAAVARGIARELVGVALRRMHAAGEVYPIVSPRQARPGRPLSTRWHVVREPVDVNQCREAIVREWQAWAMNSLDAREDELDSLVKMLRVARPHLLAWPQRTGETRAATVAEWVREWVSQQGAAR